MDLKNKKVKVIKGYYEGIEGIVVGVTADNYLLVTPKSKNTFYARTDELEVIN